MRLLADGEMHSGERLAADLGVTRAAVWKIVAELRERGIAVASHERRGYQLEQPVELLDLQSLRRSAAAACIELPAATEVFFELGSTNEYLHAAVAPLPGAPRLVFAELQTAGRGRRGREWLAPFGSGLTFSIGWTFAEMPADLSALGLALGVCVVRALRELGAADVQLKWPNDIVHRHAKLGGLLLQMRSEAGGPAYVVAGLGLNLALPEAARAAIQSPLATPVTDLADGLWRQATATRSTRRRASPAACWRDSPNSRAPALRRLPATGRPSIRCVMRRSPCCATTARWKASHAARMPKARCESKLPGGVIERVHAGDVSLRRSLQAEAMAR